jgi:hypothetical protein
MQSAAGPDYRPGPYYLDGHGELSLQANGGGEEEDQRVVRLEKRVVAATRHDTYSFLTCAALPQ